MNEETITRQLDTRWAARCLVYRDVTEGSTNDIARELADQGAVSGTLVITTRQLQGRGRNAHSWYCPDDGNIAMSLIVRPDLPLAAAPMLTLMTGLSVAEGIEDLLHEGSAHLQIKWPNDVVIGGRKVCGILTESATTPQGTLAYAIIGIGINVNGTQFPEEVKQIAGSVRTQTGVEMDRSALTACIMKHLEDDLKLLERDRDLSALKEPYERRMAAIGSRIRVLDPGEETAGICRGIGTDGTLLLETEEGELRSILAGEVSVRGICGYT